MGAAAGGCDGPKTGAGGAGAVATGRGAALVGSTTTRSNADTPGYQARDFDFNAALAAAANAGEPVAELELTQPGHMSLGDDALGLDARLDAARQITWPGAAAGAPAVVGRALTV